MTYRYIMCCKLNGISNTISWFYIKSKIIIFKVDNIKVFGNNTKLSFVKSTLDFKDTFCKRSRQMYGLYNSYLNRTIKQLYSYNSKYIKLSKASIINFNSKLFKLELGSLSHTISFKVFNGFMCLNSLLLLTYTSMGTNLVIGINSFYYEYSGLSNILS